MNKLNDDKWDVANNSEKYNNNAKKDESIWLNSNEIMLKHEENNFEIDKDLLIIEEHFEIDMEENK